MPLWLNLDKEYEVSELRIRLRKTNLRGSDRPATVRVERWSPRCESIRWFPRYPRRWETED